MAGGDFSGCVEMTSGYFGYYRFQSGKYGIAFDCTGNAVERIWGKDPTVDATNSAFYAEYLQLSCSSASVGFYDGSGGQLLARIRVSDFAVDASNSTQFVGVNGAVWDFRDDPLVCLTADNTQSLCISAGNGFVSGFIKGYWGPKPR